ncbi:hypothetical protein AK812_SmicGene28515 [Symbiodinium microadriaticum]|uniref:Uncharacterized protein n=1 Tax=Symbiodinium microadriaticum TaxID=2951 RepID=A0A1Q9D463_SYMMI|nr:hypothetical protein AK812_SmicGene28515 [Symbiodinium microadriaticum]
MLEWSVPTRQVYDSGQGALRSLHQNLTPTHEGMKLSDNYYLVDMSTDGRNLFVSAYDNTTSNTLELVIKERLHRQLYRETNGDYRQIADRLKVSGDGKLLLDGEEAPGQAASEELDAAAMTRRSNNRQPHTAR